MTEPRMCDPGPQDEFPRNERKLPLRFLQVAPELFLGPAKDLRKLSQNVERPKAILDTRPPETVDALFPDRLFAPINAPLPYFHWWSPVPAVLSNSNAADHVVACLLAFWDQIEPNYRGSVYLVAETEGRARALGYVYLRLRYGLDRTEALARIGAGRLTGDTHTLLEDLKLAVTSRELTERRLAHEAQVATADARRVKP